MNTISNRKPIGIIFSVLAVLVISISFYFLSAYFFAGKDKQETNDAQIEAYINPVSARVGGFIKSVGFEEHQLVHKGDTLLTIDDREYRQRMLEAEATVEDARAQLDVLSASISSAITATLVNRDQIAGAKAKLVLQRADMQRYEGLIEDEAVTGSDLDGVRSRLDVSQSDFNGSVNNLKTSYAKITELRSRRALLEADLKRKIAQLELARINLNYTSIVAPYDGRMGRKTILEGQQVQPGQTLALIVDENEKWVTANFKETQVYGMYVGQPVSISVDAIDNHIYDGEVEAISASTGAKFSILPPDNSTGNFVKIIQRVPVRIKFRDKKIEAIKAGMNVKVSVKMKAI